MKNKLKQLVLGLFFVMAIPAVADIEGALAKLKLPGIKFNVEKHYIDVDSVVCLEEGALELVACTKDTKEHEAIFMITAKAVHMHTALLLIGAKPGNPAMRQPIGEGDKQRWVHIPPRGGKVKISVVITDADGKEQVRPISDFIQRVAEDFALPDEPEPKKEERVFPTSTFIFTGSHLIPNGDGPRRYLADDSGNIISLSTFGDEVLSLPDVMGHENGALVWEVKSDHLPKAGSKVKLRFQPQ